MKTGSAWSLGDYGADPRVDAVRVLLDRWILEPLMPEPPDGIGEVLEKGSL